MNSVFLDTVGLLALWDASDQWHAMADGAFSALKASRRPLLTTTFVLLECGNAAARRPYRVVVPELWQTLASANALVVPDSDDVRLAWEAYRRGGADGAGIVDHVSFIVMRRLDVAEAFMNDRHFRAAGFSLSF
ncbi:MAG: hypothetical protein Q7S40_23070 [Opitutaceae bacterium]|nr:hypothetical protein [Opitutaceae bacterium]